MAGADSPSRWRITMTFPGEGSFRVATGGVTAGSENLFVGQHRFAIEINAVSSPAIVSRPTIARHLTATLVFFFEALRGCAGSQRGG